MPAGATDLSRADVPALHVDVRDPRGDAGNIDTGKTPVVLLHGWASDSLYWEPLAVRLLDAGHAVWVTDLPGYYPGEVLPPGFEWSLDSAADAVAAAIHRRQQGSPGDGRRQGPEAAGTVNVVGHSLGGSVALTLAARHPACVATLTLVGMVPAPPNEGFRSMLLSQLQQGFIDDATRDKCMAAWFGPLEPAEKDRLSQGFDVPFSVLGPSGLAALEGVPADLPALVTAPTLVLVGKGDRLRTPNQVREFVEARHARRLVAVPDAGHSVHWEQPAACATALEDFWNESAIARRKMSDI